MYKIGIIGSSGFVGKNFIQKYLNQNYFFNLFEHKTKVIKLKEGKIFKGDLANKVLNQNFFIESDVIINFSNPKNFSSSVSLNLIELCEKNKVKKLIHISTSEVFGKPKKKILNENDLCFPKNKYQLKKKEFEDILLKYSNRTRVIILRPTVVFGEGGPNLIKLISEIRDMCFIKHFLKASLFKNRNLNLISINYFCEVINFMLKLKVSKNEIYIVSQCLEKNNKYDYVYEQIHKFLNIKIKIRPFNIHQIIVRTILFFLNDSIKIDKVFDNKKLLEAGFKTKLKFDVELDKFLKNVI